MKSPISNIVTLKNRVREITFSNDFSETVELEFRENSDGEIVATDAVLSRSAEITAVDEYLRPITDVKPEEIYVSVLTEEQGELLNKHGKSSISSLKEA